MSNPSQGLIYTFYSFKGGVGRSMTLANVAAWLSKWGQRVLIVDFDLEAPGIEKYFRPWLQGGRQDGIVDLVHEFKSGNNPNWRDYLLEAGPPKARKIDIISAGRDDADYVARLRALDWEDLFENFGFGKYLETLRREWSTEYNAVLIDSRTGVTDIGGICTIHLPDVVVVMFTANEQSLVGARKVLQSARVGHNRLPIDRRRLLVVPVPSRDETNSEYKLAEQWRRERFAKELGEFFDDWVPLDDSPASVLNYLKIPYFAYWSFGERVPVLEQEDPENPKTLAAAYQPLAKLILSRMNWKEAREGVRASEEAERQAAEAEKARLKALEVAEEAKQRDSERRAEQAKKEAEEVSQRSRDYLVSRVGPAKQSLKSAATRELLWSGLSAFLLLVVFVAGGYYAYLYGPDYSQTKVTLALFAFALAVSVYFLYLRIGRNVTAKRKQVDILNREEIIFRTRVGEYSTMDQASAFSSFVNRIEGIINPEAKNLGIKVVNEDLKVESPDVRRDVNRDHTIYLDNEIIPVESFDDYQYDVFLSSGRQGLVSDWIRDQFLPLLLFWLEEELGRKPSVWVDQPKIGIDKPETRKRSLLSSKCLLALLTQSYFASARCRAEWATFVNRAQRNKLEQSDLIIPVILSGGDAFPPAVKNIQGMDFRDSLIVGPAFRDSPAYVEFQKRIKALSHALALIIERVPPFDPNSPMVTADEVDTTNPELQPKDLMKANLPRLT